jgi:oligopeptide/dipeptide ABC transporter ATP-binding protein
MELNKKTDDFLLSVKDLVVEYTSEGQVIHAVNGVSFNLKTGKTLGLVGETGAGKTSIAKAIMRILPSPQSRIPKGEIYLEGKNILDYKEGKMRKIRGNKVSMIFQDPMTALNPVMKVGDQIAEVITQHEKLSTSASLDKAVEMLKMVGISEDRAFEYPHQFSGGMKQRVVIAIALACNPTLLLADEPTTALDVTIQAQILDMIYKLREENNTAMIMITHDLGVVAESCDDVAVIYAGEIVEYGSKEDIFDTPSHPYTKGLFGSLPDLSKDVDRLSPILGLPPDPVNLPKGCHFSPRCDFATEECKKEPIALYHIDGEHYSRCILKGQEV